MELKKSKLISLDNAPELLESSKMKINYLTNNHKKNNEIKN